MSLLRTGRCPTATRHAVETKWATADPPSGAAGPAVAEPVQEQTVAEQIWDCAQDLAPVFTEVDRLVAANVRKVQKAFRDHRIGPHHFQVRAGVDVRACAFVVRAQTEPACSTGYGHGDLGREALDSVMAQIMGAEAALMRVQFVSGTHAIASALYAVLRPGDEMLAVAGHPYDTMEEVIGTRGTPGHGSLMEWGVSYRELALTGEGRIDWEALKTAIVPGKTKVAHIQRSCGYALRPTLSIDEIGKAVQIIKAQDPNVVITVDNCYGEFNGHARALRRGTIAPGGGYVAGRADLIGRVAARLYAPGVGIDAGGVPGSTLRIFFQGLFLAPQTTGEALKGGRLAAELLHREGFTVIPAPGVPEVWSMITAVELRSRERMTAFCRGIQRTCPIGSYITPEPGVTAGYGDEVIFADGTFIDGSTAELSADGPIREPYVVYCQGGTHWTHWALALEGAVTSLREAVAKDN
ncbi:hypothetical protein HYH02_000001 [Chlamydomonas schloesseri]|uniref:Uncharacterized protein n=1 Tax=Chlamydomonas schloesseri TaxID=2026947 RepID=A0A835WNH3_9CHLO|nr:hypothetical protein HYH02_000001 [Chlamydomonas schloesseri]|eukprot:KAG2449895.1 hypothetical protein HYH02_000001 [Chlamydomonas schloesseri]